MVLKSKKVKNGDKILAEHHNNLVDDVDLLSKKLGGSFDETENYPLYRSPIYIAEGLDCYFDMTSLFLGMDESSINKIYPLIAYKSKNGETKFKRNHIESNDIDDTGIDIFYNNGVDGQSYKKTIDVVTSKGKGLMENPKVLMIGDSLTEWGTPTFCKEILTKMGINATMLGTYKDYMQTPCEGRGAWTWTNYIGRNCKRGVNNISITQAAGKTSTANSCPFWKEATVEDKEKHPEWCFKYEGKNPNCLSYKESEDKTGVFYIFDMEYYLPKLDNNIPDVITIFLGTNDLIIDYNWDKNVYDLMNLSLDIMVKQIREALPKTKIGIVPIAARGKVKNKDWNENNKFIKWYNACVEQVNSYEDDNLFIVTAHPHMQQKYIWGMDEETLKYGVIKQTESDPTHFRERGQRQFSAVVASFIANAITENRKNEK